jgi:putative tryptophan/tyrosine transport system substrate-binding protein
VVDRRSFLYGSVLVLVAPLASEAQQASRTYRIGYLGSGPSVPQGVLVRAFVPALRDLGYVEGDNLVIEARSADNKPERLPALAAELVRLNVDVIVTSGNLSIAALKQATTTVPIVMIWAIDPVGAGFVASLARPGGNVTGLSMTTGSDFLAKQLEILKEIVPQVSRVAILRDTGRPSSESPALESAARKLGLTILFADVRTPNDIAGAFGTMTRSRAGAFLILGGDLTYLSRQQIADLAVQYRLPGIHLLREHAEAGLLLSYGPNIVAQFRHAATYVDKILKGAKPADLPIEQPTKFELVINMKTAKALGLTIPQPVLLRADQVIE